MKTALKYIMICLLTLQASAQQVDKLFGAHSNGIKTNFSSLNTNEGAFEEISVLKEPFNYAAVETTYDEVNSRYFFKNASTIFIVDALTGKVIDSIPNAGAFYNMEYDKTSKSLVGMAVLGKSMVFKTYDLGTKKSTVKNVLTSIDSIVVGESTFDPERRRYFSMTNLGVSVIDSNGVIIDALCASPNATGIEYDPDSNKLYYFEWNGNSYYFVSLEANTCTIDVLGAFKSITSVVPGESTFDKALGHYFCRTNLGLLQFNAKSRLILKTFPLTNNFGGLEFARLSATSLPKVDAEKESKVFPNPSNSKFNFTNLKSGATLEVFDSLGQLFFKSIVQEQSQVLDLEMEPRGVYFYRIYSSDEEIRHGKLILK